MFAIGIDSHKDTLAAYAGGPPGHARGVSEHR